MRIKFKAEDVKENNIFWVTMTDLMTAMVLVFIVMTIMVATINFKKNNNTGFIV